MSGRGERGQAMVEMGLILPMLLVLVFGVVELGTAFNETMTLAAASREGARVAGALVNGGGALGCGAGQSPNAATVDPNIVAAVERVLTASGTQISLANVAEIRLFKATSTGAETSGRVNSWTYVLNGGPVVGGDPLDFVEQSNTWTACSRSNVTPADSIGITVRYTYQARTPLRYFVPSLQTLNLRETTVMSLNASR